MVNKLMNKYERNGNKSKEVAKAREETVAVSEDRTTKALSTKYDRTALALCSIQG